MDDAAQEFDSITREWVSLDPLVEPPPVDPIVAPAAAEVVAEAKPKPRHDPQARVEAATSKEAAAKRERDEAKAEAATLTARIAELEARTDPARQMPAPRTAADTEPTVDQFETYEKFVKAQARWEARQEIQQVEQTRQEQAALQARAYQIRDVDRQFSERYTAVLARDPEFASKVDPRLLHTPRAGVLANPNDVTFGNFLIEQVFQSEQPDVLLLHLSDPATIQRLATLPPDVVIRELAKVVYSSGAASPAASVSRAPALSQAKAPIRPVGSSPLVSNDEPTDEASDEEWRRHWEASELRKRRAGRG